MAAVLAFTACCRRRYRLLMLLQGQAREGGYIRGGGAGGQGGTRRNTTAPVKRPRAKRYSIQPFKTQFQYQMLHTSAVGPPPCASHAIPPPPILLWRRGLHSKLQNIPVATGLSRCI